MRGGFVIVLLVCLLLVLLEFRAWRLAVPLESAAAAAPCSLHPENKLAVLLPGSCTTSEAMRHFDEFYEKGYWSGSSPMLTKEDFYSNADWPPRERKSNSGLGSNLGYSTKKSLDIIRKTISTFNVSAMIDIPCGDANWIFDSWETDSLKLYIGLDVVQEVTRRNAERLRFHSNKIFRHWDGTTCPLPKYKDVFSDRVRAADMVHSRDVIQHLPPDQGVVFLCNVFLSGARVFVSTSYPGGDNIFNQDATYVQNNLHASPYDLSRGECVLTHPDIEQDETCIYDLGADWVKKWVVQKGCKEKVSRV
jgi:hypothetical protein